MSCGLPTTTWPSSPRSSSSGRWIGNIHQPLHVSFADDRAGNFIRESGPCVNSLHTVWDTCIIEKKLGTDPQTIAQDLLDGLPDSDRAAWVAVPIAGWAKPEGLVLTILALGGSDPADNRKNPASAGRRMLTAPCVVNPSTDIQEAGGFNVNGGAKTGPSPCYLPAGGCWLAAG